jgi:acetoacetyl-CoA synthetase
MMWNWLISSLYFGAEVVLYEGSPAYPSLEKFLEFIDKEKVNIWGTSPKFLRAIEQYVEKIPYQFNSLETMLSTGAPLLPEQFDYVYEKIKKDILLGSISGGTDIISCFMLGNPILPVNRGEIQCLGLGMDVSSFNSKGEEVLGIEGELVCRNSFPSQPIGFLNDSNNEKFKNAYFNVFENIWHHGDFITLTKNKTVQVHGRSDATLNPGGVRIGTAEIYRQTELLDYIDDSLCVGRQVDGDVEVVLFCF